MRRAVAWLLLAGACGDGDADPAPPRFPRPPPIRWVKTQRRDWDLEIHVPEPWSREPAFPSGEEIHFSAPEDDGIRPQLQFGWKAEPRSLEEWGGRRIRAFEESPFHRVKRTGRTTVAGMPALFCVYEDDVRIGGAAREIANVAFYFAGHGHIGFVRGVCTARTFGNYRPIFEEAARRLRYNPQ